MQGSRFLLLIVKNAGYHRHGDAEKNTERIRLRENFVSRCRGEKTFIQLFQIKMSTEIIRQNKTDAMNILNFN